MYQILPLLFRSQGVPILHNHRIVEPLFAKLSSIDGFIDIVISAQIIPLLTEVYIGNPFATSFIQIDTGMP